MLDLTLGKINVHCRSVIFIQERRALESEGDSKPTDLSAIRQKGREKIIQVSKLLLLTEV